jgi:hypothetical protein
MKRFELVRAVGTCNGETCEINGVLDNRTHLFHPFTMLEAAEETWLRATQCPAYIKQFGGLDMSDVPTIKFEALKPSEAQQ